MNVRILRSLDRWWRRMRRLRRRRDRESGVALLVTISSLTLIISLVSEFTYGSTIQLAQAANARDELRAHYMARSAVALSRMLIRIQRRFVEPIMQTAQQMMQSSSSMGDMGISLRVTDYAGPIMSFFGGSKDEAAGLGGLIGIDVSQAKGLGMTSGKLDAEIASEDSKINVNCGGGSLSVDKRRQSLLFSQLSALAFSPRYNSLFQRLNAEGQFVDRMELAKAIIDWADPDEQMYSPDGSSGGAEDYRYDARAKDPYKAHNWAYDTVDELAQVRGMNADVLEAFLPYLTVYPNNPDCKVNLATVKSDCTPLLVGLIRAAVQGPDPTKPPADPTVFDDQRIYPLASILCERGKAVGFSSLDTIVNVLANPATSIARDDPRHQLMQSMRGINITRAQLEQVAFVGAPRVYRIVASGESGKVKKKITVVLDTRGGINFPLTQNQASERQSGVIRYWREE